MATKQQTGQIALTLQQFNDLSIKYASSEQQIQVLLLEQAEYKKEIAGLKDKNSQLMEENRDCTELMHIEETRMSYTQSLSTTLNHMDSNNMDLKSEVREYKKMINELKNENNLLKNENEKYKQTLLNQHELHKRRESVHITKKLDLGNKIEELKTENESLQTVIITIQEETQDTDEKHIEPTERHSVFSFSDDKDEIMRLKNLRTNSRTSPKGNGLFSEFGIASPSKSVTHHKTPDIYEHNVGSTDIYAFENRPSLNITPYDTDVPLTPNYKKNDQLNKLKEENSEKKMRIRKLKDEITKLKLLNGELQHRIDSRFKCVSFNWIT